MKKARKPGDLKRNESVRKLRDIIERTQVDFAASVGVSEHTIISVENGRNKLTPKLAQRIRMFTGADIASLMKGEGVVLDSLGKLYTKPDFDYWRKRFGISTKDEAQKRFDSCSDALWLLLHAAAKPGIGKLKDRLPAVLMSFIEWADETRRDFKLEKQIDELLLERTYNDSLTMTYDDWRKDKATHGIHSTFYRFKDDKRQPADRKLTLTLKLHPGWSGASGNMKQKSISRTMRIV